MYLIIRQFALSIAQGMHFQKSKDFFIRKYTLEVKKPDDVSVGAMSERYNLQGPLKIPEHFMQSFKVSLMLEVIMIHNKARQSVGQVSDLTIPHMESYQRKGRNIFKCLSTIDFGL